MKHVTSQLNVQFPRQVYEQVIYRCNWHHFKVRIIANKFRRLSNLNVSSLFKLFVSLKIIKHSFVVLGSPGGRCASFKS